MFYVYDLIDPRDGKTFYVGKGTGDRLKEHVRDARKGEGGPKCDRIREILAEGLTVEERIVKEFENEAYAYAYEKRRIARIGLENLTNIAPGGGGTRATEAEPTERLGPFEARANLLRIWATKQPRKGALFSQALWRALERAVPRIFEELFRDFGREATTKRLLAEYGLEIVLIENNA